MKANFARGITFKSLITGIILCFVLAVGEPIGVMLVHGSPMCADFSTGGAIFLFFRIVFLINFLLKIINKNLALSKQELIIVYLMMIIASSIISWGFMMNLLYLIAGVFYYATPENNWANLIHPHIKPWLAPQNNEAIRTFFEGLPKGGGIPWGSWFTPLSSWFSFILVVYFVMVCIAVMMRKQWVEKERLLFPLAQLPLEMAEKSEGKIPPFFKNRVMWLGFAIPAVIYSINGLSSYFSFISPIQLHRSLSIFAQTTPLSLRIFFEVIGLTFLLSTDISLSLWFFALVATLETGFFNRIGFSIGAMQLYSDPGPQTVANQGLGAMIMFVATSLWFAREHLKNVFRKAFKGIKEIDDSGEALSYRVSVFGLILGILFIGGWLKASGMNLISILVFLFFVLVIIIGLTKIVAQVGLAYGRAPVAPPIATLHSLGSSTLGPVGLVNIGLAFSWIADVRTILLASTANGLKLTDSVGIKGRRIFIPIIIAILVTLVSSAGIILFLSYKYGALNFGGWQPIGLPQNTFKWVANFIQHPASIGKAQFGWMGIGAALMLLVTTARNMFLWWPIHPVGLALGLAGPFAWVWFSVFIGWLFKALIIKYAGPLGYRVSRPFFLGLILGAFTTAGIWLIIDFFTKMTGNVFTLG